MVGMLKRENRQYSRLITREKHLQKIVLSLVWLNMIKINGPISTKQDFHTDLMLGSIIYFWVTLAGFSVITCIPVLFFVCLFPEPHKWEWAIRHSLYIKTLQEHTSFTHIQCIQLLMIILLPHLVQYNFPIRHRAELHHTESYKDRAQRVWASLCHMSILSTHKCSIGHAQIS